MSSESALGKADGSTDASDKELLCPTCGRTDFSKPGDMKVHHYQAHGESIAKVSVECAYCGESKQVVKSDAERKGRFFCNTDCKGKWQSDNRAGEKHPSWSGGKTTVKCDWCGSGVEMFPSHAKGAENHFCNSDCEGMWRSEKFSGELSPTWKGGWDEYYGASWMRQRRKARQRDNNTCQGCGATPEDVGRAMDVHHITPFRKFGVDNHEQANRIENLVCLCPSCHSDYEGLYLRPDNRK